MLQLPGSFSPVATSCTHCYTHAQKLNRIAHFWTQKRISFFFSFFSFFCASNLYYLWRLFIHLKSIGFYAVGCTFPASPFQLGSPQVPLTLRPFLPACNIAQSPYRFLCACVLLLSIFHPFPHVFLMCSCTHIVLIPLSHPVWCWNKDVVDER